MRQMAQITADELLAAARAEIGTKEQPQNSNRVKYNTAFYGREVSGAAYPWCVTFIWWLFWKLGAAELFCGGQKTASCGVVMDYAKKHSQFVTEEYRPGDLVLLRFQSSGGPQHIGLVSQVRSDGSLETIEGNTGQDSDANGGQVQQRVREKRLAVGAYRPAYREVSKSVTYERLKDIPEKFRPTIEKLIDIGVIQGDGSDPEGNGDVISLTHEQVRTLTFTVRLLERFGLYL